MVATKAPPPDLSALGDIHAPDNPISSNTNTGSGTGTGTPEARSRSRSARTNTRTRRRDSGYHEDAKESLSSSSRNSFILGGGETVGIVGSGMAGLAAAFLLGNDRQRRFEVELLEVQDVLSLDSASFELPRSTEAEAQALEIGGGLAYDFPKNARKDDQDDDNENEGRRVDLPMRAFAAGYYDNLLKMYRYLGVVFASPKFVYSISFSKNSQCPASDSKKDDEEGGAYFIHSSNNHILPPIRPAGITGTEYFFEILYLLFWYFWFTLACFWIPPKTTPPPKKGKSKGKKRRKSSASETEHAHDLYSNTTGTGETLRAYLSRVKIPTYYTTRYFLPLMSSITTCTHAELLDFPASDIINYARQTHRKPHYTLTRGVKAAEKRLSDGLNVRYNHRVTKVETLRTGRVRVHFIANQGKESEREGVKEYDRVIIATTPDVTGKIFSPLSLAMKVIPTTEVRTVVHRDRSRVGKTSAYLGANERLQKRNIKTFDQDKSIASSNGSRGPDGSCASVLTAMHMVTETDASGTTRTESIHEHPANVLVTTYALENSIAEDKILHSVRFTRVLRTSASRDVVNSLFSYAKPPGATACKDKEKGKDAVAVEGWKNGDGNVYVVGGWCWDGMVLLEGCVVSAVRVANELGIQAPWDQDEEQETWF
ncbi:uncharacterized protein DSM5745_10995 [Aspergillus mulundensis]|uniref:Amine oxidase domain-containing protein n=1 Tax=Aspergillus mulundensis TaxID=1810919 RepID=A0A3D8QCD7_9EURO|nr:Uncharacterized protein DSM5745_10995 [Aspergillus mulundensis]RDW59300.1 Uncharacterized protein DSM5745_10995 [Aspergillus mulundensis]